MVLEVAVKRDETARKKELMYDGVDVAASVVIVDVERDEAVVAAEVLVGEGDDIGCRYYL